MPYPEHPPGTRPAALQRAARAVAAPAPVRRSRPAREAPSCALTPPPPRRYALFEGFIQYNVSDSRIIRGDDGRCLGYGFVTIRTQDDANKAVQEMDGNRLNGRPLRVSLSRTPRLSAPPTAHGNRPADPPPSTDVNVVARQVPPPSPPPLRRASCHAAVTRPASARPEHIRARHRIRRRFRVWGVRMAGPGTGWVGGGSRRGLGAGRRSGSGDPRSRH